MNFYNNRIDFKIHHKIDECLDKEIRVKYEYSLFLDIWSDLQIKSDIFRSYERLIRIKFWGK